MPKYQIKPHHLEDKGGCERLRHDGFTREQISKAMYKLTDGASQEYRTKLMDNLHHQERERGRR